MTDSLAARIAEAKARAKLLYELTQGWEHFSPSNLLAAECASDSAFLADHAAEQAAQLARAHAVIEAARVDFKDMRRLMDYEGRSGYTADMASAEERCARYLADFDREMEHPFDKPEYDRMVERLARAHAVIEAAREARKHYVPDTRFRDTLAEALADFDRGEQG